MYVLACAQELRPVMTLIGYAIEAIKIGIPIILIILGMIDLGKAVIASKEDEVKKARSAFIKRLIYAVLVFAVVWIVQLVLSLATSLFSGEEEQLEGTSDWRGCWNCILSKGEANDKCVYTKITGETGTGEAE